MCGERRVPKQHRGTARQRTTAVQPYAWQENPTGAFLTYCLSEVGTKGERRKSQAQRFGEQRKDLFLQQRAVPRVASGGDEGRMLPSLKAATLQF